MTTNEPIPKIKETVVTVKGNMQFFLGRAPLETTPNRGGKFRVCAALGKIFSVTFSALAPCSRPALAPLPQGGGPGLGAGGGRAQREVAPKILPRATQTRNFPPRLGVVFV